MKRVLYPWALICLFNMGQAHAEACATVYEHANFGGAAWDLQANTEHPSIGGAMIERRRWRGHLRGWSGRDRSWNDAISSVRVLPQCELSLFEHDNFTGRVTTYIGGVFANDVGQVALNDTTTAFRCKCGHGAAPQFLRAPLP